MNHDFLIKLATPSGGKAGKGFNKTSTVQVMHCNMILKSFRFDVGNRESLRHATLKATVYVRKLSVKP